MFFLIAITFGFLGSFHCVGMCGPIALSIPLKNKNRILAKLSGALIYNFGRAITYFFLGFLFGLIGQRIAITGFQNVFSVFLGVLILLTLLLPRLFNKSRQPTFWLHFLNTVKKMLAGQFNKNTYRSLLTIGLLNALLPCGLVYMAITASLALGDSLKGALFMAAFGLGTIPAMLAVSLSQHLISLNIRSKINKAVPVFVGLMAIMLILRGLNLGIPYLSPKVINEQGLHKHQCCSKPQNS
jgi:sulfite exporter TauE/SafE